MTERELTHNTPIQTWFDTQSLSPFALVAFAAHPLRYMWLVSPTTLDTVRMLSRPTLRCMIGRVQLAVIAAAEYFKVFNPVVSTITVLVMDMFTALQWPAKMLLHHMPVLIRRSSSFANDVENDVTIHCSFAAASLFTHNVCSFPVHCKSRG